MDGLAFQLAEQFEVIYCCNCKMSFAVPARVRAVWVEKGGTFHCPQGHPQHYTESDVQKLRKQLERTERERTWAQDNAKAERLAREATERRLIGQKAAKTRLRNRIKNGVCPCCTRSFVNLREHIATKHPDFKADEDLRDAQSQAAKP
jgi:hypothetical protein